MLNDYAAKYGSIRVAVNLGTHWVHEKYPGKEASYWIEQERGYDDGVGLTDRQILKDEIVIESDMNMRHMNRAVANTIEKLFLDVNYSFKKWFTGGKSYHIHTTFPELMFINNNDDLKLLKELFIKWVYCVDGVDCRYDNGCKIVKHKVDMQLTGRVLIRIEYGRHPNGARKYLVTENEVDRVNRIPRVIWEKFSQVKNYYRIYKRKRNSLDMPCIKYLYTNAVPDCRKRVAFVLYNNLKLQFGESSAEIMFKEWNKNINSNYATTLQIRAIVRSGKKTQRAPSHRFISRLLAELDRLDVCSYCEAEVV